MLWTYKSIPCTVRLHCCHLVRDDRKRELPLGNDTISHILNMKQLLHMRVHKHLTDPNLRLWCSNSSSSCLGEVAHLSGRRCYREGTCCCAALPASNMSLFSSNCEQMFVNWRHRPDQSNQRERNSFRLTFKLQTLNKVITTVEMYLLILVHFIFIFILFHDLNPMLAYISAESKEINGIRKWCDCCNKEL